MARTAVITDRFRRTQKLYGLTLASPGYLPMNAMIRAMAALEPDELPGPQDQKVQIPPAKQAWARRVEGHNIWLFFSFDENKIYFEHIVISPPIPLDQ